MRIFAIIAVDVYTGEIYHYIPEGKWFCFDRDTTSIAFLYTEPQLRRIIEKAKSIAPKTTRVRFFRVQRIDETREIKQ